MSKRLTITLTDEEYAYLEQRAAADRRSVRDMAARLVTQTGVIVTPDWTYRSPVYPSLWPPAVTSGTIRGVDTTTTPNGFTIWNSQNTCDARSN